MKNLKKIALLFVAVAAVSLTACKDDDDGDSTPSNTDNIVEKNFRITDFNATLDGAAFLSFADFDDCEKDNFTRFERNGSATDDEGAAKCDPSDPQTDTYSWHFINNETKLVLDFGMGEIDTLSIQVNDGTTLRLDQTDLDDYTGDGNNNTVISTVTFTKQ